MRCKLLIFFAIFLDLVFIAISFIRNFFSIRINIKYLSSSINCELINSKGIRLRLINPFTISKFLSCCRTYLTLILNGKFLCGGRVSVIIISAGYMGLCLRCELLTYTPVDLLLVINNPTKSVDMQRLTADMQSSKYKFLFFCISIWLFNTPLYATRPQNIYHYTLFSCSLPSGAHALNS
jgi:hypothetical protein